MHYMNRQGETAYRYSGLGADSDYDSTKRVFDTIKDFSTFNYAYN